MRHLVLILLGALGPAAVNAAETAAADDLLTPFLARYELVWRGFNAGTTELELSRAADGQFVYASRANARGLFRAFFSEEITQTSWFSLANGGVRPTRYRGDDGTDSAERDIAFDFDWAKGRASGTAEEKAVDVALEPGTQDPMSIQIAQMRDLLSGEKTSAYRMLDKHNIKEYSYAYEGEARVQTAVGEVDTVIYRSQRVGSKRVTRTWYAPALGYVAVRAEQMREGKREWLMQILSLKRG